MRDRTLADAINDDEESPERVVDVERAGFETLSADRQAAIAAHQAAAERARRIAERGEELVAALRDLLPIARRESYSNAHEANLLEGARALLVKIEGRSA